MGPAKKIKKAENQPVEMNVKVFRFLFPSYTLAIIDYPLGNQGLGRHDPMHEFLQDEPGEPLRAVGVA